MFLKALTSVLALFAYAANAQPVVATEHQWTDDIVGSHVFQLGMDAWHIHTSASEDTTENMNSLSRLQLANSYPVWSSFRQVSPWGRFDGGLRVGQDTLLTLKFRNDQSTGARVDEASVDRAFHTFGVKLGVVDPKISWCRTYDVDSPWIRENNPFCSIKPLNFARGSAPGGQAYANFIMGDYSLQAIAGAYRPLMFGYEANVAPTIVLSSKDNVMDRTKTGFALSATNLKNGTEFRMSLMKDQYSTYRPETTSAPARQKTMNADILFLGGAWYASEKLVLRGSYFMYEGPLEYTDFDLVTYVNLHDDKKNDALTFEVNYQANSRDVFSAAHATFGFYLDQKLYRLNGNTPELKSISFGTPEFVTKNTSLSWRRDWGRGMFTVLQFSDAQTNQSDSKKVLKLSSNGQAIGLRLGYRF